MNFFLKLKHWQLFILMIILPPMVMMTGDASSFIVRLIYGIIGCGSFLGWLYFLGIALSKKLPQGMKMNLFYFKISFLILIFFFFGTVMFELLLGTLKHDYIFILLPLILFLWIWVFYIFYYVSRSLKMVELQRTVTYNEYMDTFFLIWFYPFGIWFIQPRVNELFKNNN